MRKNPDCPKFSLGLDFYAIIELEVDALYRYLSFASREEIIDWLQWNDRNGVYRDEESLVEFDTIVSKEEGIEIVMRQIREG